jgi:hypothetical protein|tara:strand:+ start:1446 stop:3896 length:2451 start_codon:yes stop_codon:yes gene_type:complete
MRSDPESTTSVVRESRARIAVWCALAAIVIWYLHAELYTVYGPFLKLREWGPPPLWAQVVRQTRWVARGIAAVSAAILVVLEIRSGTVRKLCRQITESHSGLIIALVFVGIVSGIDYLLPGYLQATDDAESYSTIAWPIWDALRHGQLPIWTNWGDMGYPLTQFYSPLYSTLIAVVSIVIPNVWSAVKLLHLTYHVMSVLAIFLYVHNLTKSKYAAITAGFALGFAFYRYHVFFYLGSLNMGPTFVIWPFQLYLVDRYLMARDGRRIGVALALVSAAGLLFHAYFGGYGGLFTALYGVLRILTGPKTLPTARRKVGAILHLYFWLGSGVLASSFYTLPALLESDLSLVQEWVGGDFLLPPVSVQDVLTFEGGESGSGWWGGYLGVSVMAMALVGYISALLGRRWATVAPFALLLLSLFLALGPFYLPFSEIFSQIPGGSVVFLFHSPGDYLVYVVIMGAAGVGVCIAEFADGLLATIGRGMAGLRPFAKIGFIRMEWILWCICGLIALDMFRYHLFVNYMIPVTANGSPENRVAAHQWLAKHRHQIDGRVLDLGQSDIVWYIPMIANLPTYSTQGFASRWSAPLVAGLRRFDPVSLFDEGSNLMRVANTAMVVVDSPSQLENYPGAIKSGDGAVMIPTDRGLVMIASSMVKEVNLDIHFRATEAAAWSTLSETPHSNLANEMGIDPLRAAAEFIPAPDPLYSLDVLSDDRSLTARVQSHDMESQYVRIEYSVSTPAYVQLSYAYYPYLRVLIDGTEAPSFPTSFGLIGVQSPAGAHILEIVPYLSPLRVIVGAVNLLSIVGLVAVWALSFRKRLGA